jgi:hypothetical protein
MHDRQTTAIRGQAQEEAGLRHQLSLPGAATSLIVTMATSTGHWQAGVVLSDLVCSLTIIDIICACRWGL